MNLAQRYSKSLSNLKPLLPRGYQAEISIKSGVESINTVKNAFRGRLKDSSKLIKILTVARQLAKNNVEQSKKASKETRKLLKNTKRLV